MLRVDSRAFSAAVALAVLVGATAARAADVQVSLDYQTEPALSACPRASEFRAQIARQLGRDPFREQAARRLIVRVAPAGGHLEGRVEWRDANDQWEGERTFSWRSESCDQMIRAMALATAIQIQLLGMTKGAEPEPPPAVSVAPPPPPPAVRAPIPVAAPPVAPPPPRREPWVAVEAGLSVAVDLGGAPALMAPRLALAIGRPSFAVRLAAVGFGPPADVRASQGAAQVDRIQMTLQALRFFRRERRLQPFVALGGGWQELRVRGSSAVPSLGQAHDGHVFSALVAAGGGLAVSFATGLFVIVEVDGALYSPSMSVQVGSATSAANFAGQSLLAEGGLLARF